MLVHILLALPPFFPLAFSNLSLVLHMWTEERSCLCVRYNFDTSSLYSLFSDALHVVPMNIRREGQPYCSFGCPLCFDLMSHCFSSKYMAGLITCREQDLKNMRKIFPLQHYALESKFISYLSY